MYILASGDSGTPVKDFIWLKEFTDIKDFQALRTKIKKNKEYKDKIIVMFDIKDYTDNRSGNIQLLKTKIEVDLDICI